MYKVIKLFTDLQDDDYVYEIGDSYPRDGLEPSKDRYKELASKENLQGVPLIEEVKDKAKKG